MLPQEILSQTHSINKSWSGFDTNFAVLNQTANSIPKIFFFFIRLSPAPGPLGFVRGRGPLAIASQPYPSSATAKVPTKTRKNLANDINKLFILWLRVRVHICIMIYN